MRSVIAFVVRDRPVVPGRPTALQKHAQDGMQASMQRMERLHREIDDERKKTADMQRLEHEAAGLRTIVAQQRQESGDLRAQLASLQSQLNAAEHKTQTVAERRSELEIKVRKQQLCMTFV